MNACETEQRIRELFDAKQRVEAGALIRENARLHLRIHGRVIHGRIHAARENARRVFSAPGSQLSALGSQLSA